MSLLEVSDLKTYFKTQEGTLKAVDGISFNLEKGQAMGLAGESGHCTSCPLQSHGAGLFCLWGHAIHAHVRH